MYHQAAVILATLELVDEGLERLEDLDVCVDPDDDVCIDIAEGVMPYFIAPSKGRAARSLIQDDGPGVALEVGIIGDEDVLGLRIFLLNLMDYLIVCEDVCQD